ncbi:MAG: alpha/beta hydrolase [Victivallaceae bacterium]|nr:alpha/beta hydrolase [Victivallaceae bacterium]
MNIKLNIPYGKYFRDRRIMDIFLPDKANGCAILFIHGGGWRSGKKESWHSVAGYFAERGFACACMEYRLSGQAAYPAQVEDIRLGMSYFRRNAGFYGFAPERIAVAGSSAGGHLAALLSSLAPESLLGVSPELEYTDTRPNAAVLYCPVTTLCRLNGIEIIPEAVKLFMNNKSEQEAPAVYREASPLEHVTVNNPPTLFLHGDKDETVPLLHSEEMAGRLKRAGVYAELHVLPDAPHGFGYGTASKIQKKALEYMERFLKKHLCRQYPT